MSAKCDTAAQQLEGEQCPYLLLVVMVMVYSKIPEILQDMKTLGKKRKKGLCGAIDI